MADVLHEEDNKVEMKTEDEEVKPTVDDTASAAPGSTTADDEGHDEVGQSLQNRVQAKEEAS